MKRVAKELAAEEGMRGARLATVYPEIMEIQLATIVEAVKRATINGVAPRVDILVPMVSSAEEMAFVKTLIDKAIAPVRDSVKIGAGIETTQGALARGEIAAKVDFLTFDTDAMTRQRTAMSPAVAKRLVSGGTIKKDPYTTFDKSCAR